MILTYSNIQHEADKVVKTSDSIIGYIGDKEVFSFRGVKNFDLFSLEGGFYSEIQSDKERIRQLEIELNELRNPTP